MNKSEKLKVTYLKYGVSSLMADRLILHGISATALRDMPLNLVSSTTGLSRDDIKAVKKLISRPPILEKTVIALLINSNFTCCCCKGSKSDGYVIHHITEFSETQDHSYDNLAVLCPNDHDLAHRSPKLSNALTPEQIRIAKLSWESMVARSNMSKAMGEKNPTLLELYSKYKEISAKLSANRSSHNKSIENALEDSSEFLIQEAEMVNQKLKSEIFKNLIEPEPSINPKAYFNNRELDITEALGRPNMIDIESELQRIDDVKEIANRSLLDIAEKYIDRAYLNLISGDLISAAGDAGEYLRIVEQVFDANNEKYSLNLIRAFERTGSVYFNAGETESALSCFSNALTWVDGFSEKFYTFSPIDHANIVGNIGACHNRNGDYDKAKLALESALEILQSYRGILEGALDFQIDKEIEKVKTNISLNNAQLKDFSVNEEWLEIIGKGFDFDIDYMDAEREYMKIFSMFKNKLSEGRYDVAKDIQDAYLPHLRQLSTKLRKFDEHLVDFLLESFKAATESGKYVVSESLYSEAVFISKNLTRRGMAGYRLYDSLMYKAIFLMQNGRNEYSLIAQEVLSLLPDDDDPEIESYRFSARKLLEFSNLSKNEAHE